MKKKKMAPEASDRRFLSEKWAYFAMNQNFKNHGMLKQNRIAGTRRYHQDQCRRHKQSRQLFLGN